MESIERFVTGQLAAWEVPGCAVAAVRDGDVVLAAGWGQRDQAAGTPVTKDTLFAIGSVTKAFTVAAVGALVDDGLLEWDRPLQDYLPGPAAARSRGDRSPTIADLLAHRSGLPRHDLTWIGHPDRTRADLVRRLRFLPLSRDLRQEFQYCNLGYLVAGHLVEALVRHAVGGFPRSRLLTPLGMGRSNLSVGEMLADPDHATAYERRPVSWSRAARPVTALAPAGAINSCAADMTRWLLAQLGGGQRTARPSCRRPRWRGSTPRTSAARGPDLPASTRHAYGLGLDDRPVPRAPARRARRRHRRVPDRVHAAARRRHRRHRADQHLLQRHGTGRRVPGARRAARAGAAGLVLDLKPRFDAAMAGMREARGARRVVADAPLAPAAGRLRRRVRASRLRRAQRHRRRGDPPAAPRHAGPSLAHRHYETFDLEWHELGDQSHIFPLMFLSDPDGDITGLTVPFEPSSSRCGSAGCRTPRPGSRGAPRGCAAPTPWARSSRVALRGDRVLTVTAPGAPPFELQPVARACASAVQDQPAITAEFELDDTGAVARLVAQPLGIFLPKT